MIVTTAWSVGFPNGVKSLERWRRLRGGGREGGREGGEMKREHKVIINTLTTLVTVTER